MGGPSGGDEVAIVSGGAVEVETEVAGIVDLDDDEDVQLTVPPQRSVPQDAQLQRAGKKALAALAGGSAVDIESGSSGSSSSSSSRSRSRSQRGRANKHLGAAAAAALVTAVNPLDVDECDRLAELEQLHKAQAEQELAASKCAELEGLEQLEIPSQHLRAVANDSIIAAIRERCGGIMIAMMPSAAAGGPATAYIGPGERSHVMRAKEELCSRLSALGCAVPVVAERSPAAAKNVERPAAVPPSPTEAVERRAEAASTSNTGIESHTEMPSTGPLIMEVEHAGGGHTSSSVLPATCTSGGAAQAPSSTGLPMAQGPPVLHQPL